MIPENEGKNEYVAVKLWTKKNVCKVLFFIRYTFQDHEGFL